MSIRQQAAQALDDWESQRQKRVQQQAKASRGKAQVEGGKAQVEGAQRDRIPKRKCALLTSSSRKHGCGSSWGKRGILGDTTCAGCNCARCARSDTRFIEVTPGNVTIIPTCVCRDIAADMEAETNRHTADATQSLSSISLISSSAALTSAADGQIAAQHAAGARSLRAARRAARDVPGQGGSPNPVRGLQEGEGGSQTAGAHEPCCMPAACIWTSACGHGRSGTRHDRCRCE